MTPPASWGSPGGLASFASAPRTPQPRPRPRRRLLGHILTREGLITPAQLEHALRLQDTREPHRLLGQILVDQGAVEQRQLDVILEKYCQEGRLGALLVETRVISEDQWRIARGYQKKTDLDLGEILVQLDFLTERCLKAVLAQQLNIRFVDLDFCTLDPDLSSLINESYARRHRVIPIARRDDQITVCLENPVDLEVVEELRASIGSKVAVVTSTRDMFERAVDRVYERGREPKLPLPSHDARDVETLRAPAPVPGATPGPETPRIDAPKRRDLGGICREERSAMVVDNGSNPESVVEIVRRMTTDCQAAVGRVDSLIQESRAQRARFEQLQREHEDLRSRHEELRHHLDACVEALAKVEAERDALLRECETGAAALAELRERYEALAQTRELARSQMEAALRQLGA
jgi:hypothetical protein